MKRYLRSSCAAFTVVLAGCQWASVRSGDDEKRKLEERVADLETRLQATPSPTPDSLDVGPAEAASSGTEPTIDTKDLQKQETSVTATSAAVPPKPRSEPIMAVSPAARDSSKSAPATTQDKRETVVREWSIENGSELTLVFETPISSQSSRVGDSVTTRVEHAVDADGRVCLPGGSTLGGRVTSVKGAARVGGKASLAMTFDRLTVRRQKQRIEPFSVVLQGGSDLKRDGALVAGGAIAGAVLGGILDGGKGAKKGAAVGAVGGAGAAVATKGEKIELNAGQRLIVSVSRTARVQK
ncbi:MAG: hypothetical protein JXO72_00400 [Vicinamibacteria bacterium]|nr:hypothetical protein [Vicinamibacteria bacterium]